MGYICDLLIRQSGPINEYCASEVANMFVPLRRSDVRKMLLNLDGYSRLSYLQRNCCVPPVAGMGLFKALISEKKVQEIRTSCNIHRMSLIFINMLDPKSNSINVFNKNQFSFKVFYTL